jgi:hypothetical protein
MGSPSATWGDTPDLFDVHVDEFAGPVSFVTHRSGLRSTDPFTSEGVTLPQAGDSVATQDPGHGPGRDPEFGTQPVGTPPMAGTSRHHGRFHCRTDPSRYPVRARRAIHQASISLGVETGHPPMGALSRDPHGLGHMGHRHSLIADPLYEETTTMHGETSVTVTHEDLRWDEDGNLHSTRRSSLTSTL